MQSLPTITHTALADGKRCLVTVDDGVYDVTSFLPDHPGGPELIEAWRGKDVKAMMADIPSHEHSDAAYEILAEFLIGRLPTTTTITNKKKTKNITGSSDSEEEENDSLPDSETTVAPDVYATGLSCEEDLNVPTNIEGDYARHKFLDLSRPLLPQVYGGGFSKQFYMEQVHRPRHYPYGSALLMPYAWMEPFSKTPWWLVPTLWFPAVIYGLYVAGHGLSNKTLAFYWVLGLFIWTLVEYGMHRFLFHVDQWLPDNRWFLTVHFLLHGVHHYLPTDRLRLVMPPALFLALAYPWYRLAHLFFPYYTAIAIYSGGITGYIFYDTTHYLLHHKSLPSYWKGLKKHHLAHHYKNFDLGYGVSSKFWDIVFGTQLDLGPKVKSVD